MKRTKARARAWMALIVWFSAILFWLAPFVTVQHAEKNTDAHVQKPALPTPTPSIQFKDQRARKLYTFLVGRNSPLADHADFFVEMADKYALPYNLSVAIACKESSCGKNLANDYNAWGITSGKAHPRFRAFSSWQEGIEAHAALLSGGYRLSMVSGMQEKYCPSFECSNTWSEDVTDFSEQIMNEEVKQ